MQPTAADTLELVTYLRDQARLIPAHGTDPAAWQNGVLGALRSCFDGTTGTVYPGYDALVPVAKRGAFAVALRDVYQHVSRYTASNSAKIATALGVVADTLEDVQRRLSAASGPRQRPAKSDPAEDGWRLFEHLASAGGDPRKAMKVVNVARSLGMTEPQAAGAIRWLLERQLVDAAPSTEGGQAFATVSLSKDAVGMAWELGMDKLGRPRGSPVPGTPIDVSSVKAPLDAAAQFVLDLVADRELSRAEPTPIEYVRLTAPFAIVPSPDRAVEQLAALQLIEVEVRFGGISLLPRGILHYGRNIDVASLAHRILEYLHRRIDAENVDFKEFDWADLKDAGVVANDEAFPLALSVIEILRLRGPGGQWSKGPPVQGRWGAPHDKAAFRRAASLDDLCLRADGMRGVNRPRGNGMDAAVDRPSPDAESRKGIAAPVPVEPSLSAPSQYVERDEDRRTTGVDFVIITALEEELDAVRSKLPSLKRVPPDEHDVRVYYKGELAATPEDGTGSPSQPTAVYSIVALTLLGMGRVEAASTTKDAIARWHPRKVLLVGIAGGIKDHDVAIGDVLLANQVVDYELQKVRSEGAESRPEVYRVDPRLFGEAKALPASTWQALVSAERPEAGEPRRHNGPIATGDKVVADPVALEDLRKRWPKLIGLEMEAGGVASACHGSAQPPGFLMVRAASDLADAEKDAARVKAWRSYACDVAASFTIALLRSMPVPPRDASTARGVAVTSSGEDERRASVQRLADAANRLTAALLMTFARSANEPPRGVSPDVLAYARLIQETRNHYSKALYEALTHFHHEAQHAYTAMARLDEENLFALPSIHARVEQARHELSSAMHAELHGSVNPSSRLALSLDGSSDQAGYAFVATIENIGRRTIADWAIEIELPALLVPDAEKRPNYVAERSSRKRATFRLESEGMGLWPKAKIAFRVPYEISEQVQGARGLPVQAVAYVGGELDAENSRVVGVLSAFFAPAVVAQRESMKALLARAANPFA